MIVALAPVLAAVIGALVFALASNAKVQEMGRLVFAAGMLVLIWVMASKTVHIG